MALSFGNLIPSSSVKMPFSLGYPVGDTRNNPSVYDDEILRRARNTSAGQPNAKKAQNPSPVLSYGSTVPKYSDPFASGQNLSYGSAVPKSKTTTSFFPSAKDFLSLASFGFEAGDTRNENPDVYDDAILRAGRAVDPIPKVSTGNIDGGSSTLSVLKGLAQSALANMGSSGDGEIIQASYGGDDSGGGINPLWIAGAAVAAGAVYYMAAK